MATVFDLELHDGEKFADSDDDIIEVDDVSFIILVLSHDFGFRFLFFQQNLQVESIINECYSNLVVQSTYFRLPFTNLHSIFETSVLLSFVVGFSYDFYVVRAKNFERQS